MVSCVNLDYRNIDIILASRTQFPTKTQVANALRLLTTSRKHSRHVFAKVASQFVFLNTGNVVMMSSLYGKVFRNVSPPQHETIPCLPLHLVVKLKTHKVTLVVKLKNLFRVFSGSCK